MINSDESAKVPDKNRSRSRRRNERRNRNRQNKFNQERANGPECSICSKIIRDISAAMTDTSTEKPAHFDCILNKVTENESVGKEEKVIYLGSGNFGVVKITNNKKFEIIKKIQYEAEVERIPWRKDMRFNFPENKKKPS